MPDKDEGVRVAGTIRTICVVTSAVTFTQIARKLLLVEAIEKRIIMEEIEGVLTATVKTVTRGTVTAKGATEKDHFINHPPEGMSRETATAKSNAEEERPTGRPRNDTSKGTATAKKTPEEKCIPDHPRTDTATITNRKRHNEDPI